MNRREVNPVDDDTRAFVRSLYAAYTRGDLETILEAFSEDIVWIEPEGSPYPGTHEGPEGVLEGIFTPLARDWSTFEAMPEEMVNEDGRVVVLGTQRGTYEATGRSVRVPFVHLIDLDEEGLHRVRVLYDTASLRRAMELPDVEEGDKLATAGP